MNKEITVIELLNRIEDKNLKNGTKIMARKNLSYVWFLYEENNIDYIQSQLLKIINLVGINGKVTIEKDKPIIEKIKRYEFKENGITISEQPSIIEIADKLNEVIDHINRKELLK